jgi:hypothetical protein
MLYPLETEYRRLYLKHKYARFYTTTLKGLKELVHEIDFKMVNGNGQVWDLNKGRRFLIFHMILQFIYKKNEKKIRCG